MSSYLISINHNFYNYSINYDDSTFDIFNNFYALSPTSSTSYEIYPYLSDYYKINLPYDVNYHDINIKINTNSDNFFIQLYLIDNSNIHYIIPLSENNKFEYNLKGLSSSIKKTYIVATNCNLENTTLSVDLTYTNHNFSNHYCTLCGEYLEDHSYTSRYSYLNKTTHYAFCDCREKAITSHVIESNTSSIKKTCIYCGVAGIFGITKE